MSCGKTNRPIAKLYLLEINSLSEAIFDKSLQLVTVPDRPEMSAVNTLPTYSNQSRRETNSTRPVRDSPQKAKKNCAKWVGSHSFGGPE